MVTLFLGLFYGPRKVLRLYVNNPGELLARGGHLSEIIFKYRLEVAVETRRDLALIPGRVPLCARFWRALSYNNGVDLKGLGRYVLT
jgi:hypothetical protein